MKKNLLFLLIAMLLPLVSVAENKAISISGATQVYNTSRKTEARVCVSPDEMGYTLPMTTSSNGWAVGTWFNTTKVLASGMYTFGNVLRFGSYKQCSLRGACFVSQYNDGTLVFHTNSNDNIDGGEGDFATWDYQNYKDNALQIGKITTGTWHHVLVSSDIVAKRVDIYLDGVKVASSSARAVGYKWADGIFELGGYGYTGLFDEVQVFNKALSDEEALIASHNAKTVDGLVGLFTFDEEVANGEFANQVSTYPDTKATFNSTTYASYFSWGGGPYTDGADASIKAATGAATLVAGRPEAKEYTLTVPEQVEGGSFTVYVDGEAVEAGTHTVKDDQAVKVVTNPTDGYLLQTLKIGDLEVENDQVIFLSGDATVEVEFTNNLLTLTIVNEGEIPYVVYFGETNITNQITTLLPGKTYMIRPVVPETKVVTAVKFNGVELEGNNFDGYNFTMEENSTIEIVSRDKELFTITIPRVRGGVVKAIQGTSTELESGTQVIEGTILTLGNTPDAGYKFYNYLVNGETYTENTVEILGNTVLSAVFEEGVDYCECAPVTGHLYDKSKSTGSKARYVTGISVSDGESTIELDPYQVCPTSSSRRMVYIDHSDQILTTQPGRTISVTVTATSTSTAPTNITSIFADWGRDGLTHDEDIVVQGMDNTADLNGTFTFTVPNDLPGGKYRVRYKADRYDQDPCVYGQKGNDFGECAVDFTLEIPKETLAEERTVTVVSNDDALGTAMITSPWTETNSVTTDEPIVILQATAADDAVFVSWTNEAGEVLSTDATYNYPGTETQTVTANFGYSVVLDNALEGGVATFTIDGVEYGDSELAKAVPGTVVTLNVTPDEGMGATVRVNRGIVTLTDNTYSFELEKNTTIEVEYARMSGSLTVIIEGEGDVIVSSGGTAAAGPTEGTILNNGDIVPSSGYSFKVFAKPADGYKIATDGLSYTRETAQGEVRTDVYSITTAVKAAGYEGYFLRNCSAGAGEVIIAVTFEVDDAQGIEEIGIDAANGPVEIYNLQGVRVATENLTKGLYILRQGTKVSKVLIQK